MAKRTVVARALNKCLRLAKMCSKKLMQRLVSISRKLGLGDFVFRLLGLPGGVRGIEDLEPVIIYPAKKLQSGKPKHLNGSQHPCFLPERYFPECFVLRMINGISSSDGYAMTSRGEIILEASIEMHFGNKYPRWEAKPDLRDYALCQRSQMLPQVGRYEEQVLTITTRWQENYFHWLYDVLPRIHLAQKAGFAKNRLYAHVESKFQRETLELLGYETDDIVNATEHGFMCSSNLIVPSVPGIPGIIPEWACEFLRGSFLKYAEDVEVSKYKGCKRVYVSRAAAQRRKIENEEEIELLLRKYDFIAVRSEELGFLEQVNLFRNAEIIVSGHGSGLANIVFCNKGTKVIELFAPAYVNPCFWTLCQATGLEYYYVIGIGQWLFAKDTEIEGEENRYWSEDGCGKDIRVDCTVLEESIGAALQT